MLKKTISMVLMACFVFSFALVAIVSADNCQKTAELVPPTDPTIVEDVVDSAVEAAEATAAEATATEATTAVEQNAQEVAEEVSEENPAKDSI